MAYCAHRSVGIAQRRLRSARAAFSTHNLPALKASSKSHTQRSKKFATATRLRPNAKAEQSDGEAQQRTAVSDGRAADVQSTQAKPLSKGGRTRQPESTDWISSQLTRRFGIAGGLAWFAFLAVGSLGEQVKTRLEVSREAAGAQDVDTAPVTLPSGVVYQDVRIGGGSLPKKGDLVVLQYRASAGDTQFEDTFARGKPIVFPFKSRPFTGGINAGVEEVLSTMRAGGKRTCVVPPAAGFGDVAYSIRNTRHASDKDAVIPASSTLAYELELVRVSIPPS